MKSSGQTRLPTGSSALSEPTEPIASTRSQPPSTSGRRLAAWSIWCGRPVVIAAVALDDRRTVLGRGGGDRVAPRAEGTLPSITARRPIEPRSYARLALKAAAASSWSTIGWG